MDWVIKYWPFIMFGFGQVLVGWKAYDDMKNRVRIHDESIAMLEADFEKHLKDASPMMKEFLELQVEFKNLVKQMEDADEAAAQERGELLARIDAVGTTITQRIDSLFRMLAEKGKGGN